MKEEVVGARIFVKGEKTFLFAKIQDKNAWERAEKKRIGLVYFWLLVFVVRKGCSVAALQGQ